MSSWGARVRGGRRGAVLLAAAVAAVAAPQASAAPYAGTYRYLQPQALVVAGTDGARWELRIAATQSDGAGTGSEQRLYVDLERCTSTGRGCALWGFWVKDLTGKEVAVAPDASSGRLATQLGGARLLVELEHAGVPGPGTSVAGPVAVGGSDLLDVSSGLDESYDGDGQLVLGRRACDLRGRLGVVALVDSKGRDARERRTAPPASLPAAFTKGRLLGC